MAATPPVCDFGTPAPDFALPDIDGRLRSRDELKGPNGLLVVFICNHCPYVKAIADKIAAEGRALALLGVGMVAISANDAGSHPEDGPDRMAEFARAHGFPFPYLYDESQDVARAYGAVCTPDFFGYNAALELQYRGRLDASGRAAAPDAPNELRAAMERIAATGRGPEAQTASIGCSIKWKS